VIIRDLLSALKIFAGINPQLEQANHDRKNYIPDKFKAVCLISADFELAWAFCHSKQTLSEPERPKKLGVQTRINLPVILELCDKYEIPITWATVGHLFLNKCLPAGGIKHPNLSRLPYFNNEFWEFQTGDWFDHDPCTDEITDPAWYGSDLIDSILSRRIKHEIGCHTFSHIDCSDERCPQRVFEDEIKECLSWGQARGITQKSFVHPGHQIGHLKDLVELGFESYRTDNGNWLGSPRKDITGLWELKNTAEITLHNNWSKTFHNYYYQKIIEKAIMHHKTAVLWFHPSCPADMLEQVMLPLFAFLNSKKDDIWITTHSQYTDYLNTIV
jgi:hypothetical protein